MGENFASKRISNYTMKLLWSLIVTMDTQDVDQKVNKTVTIFMGKTDPYLEGWDCLCTMAVRRMILELKWLMEMSLSASMPCECNELSTAVNTAWRCHEIKDQNPHMWRSHWPHQANTTDYVVLPKDEKIVESVMEKIDDQYPRWPHMQLQQEQWLFFH